MISLSEGLKHSLIVLEHLRQNADLEELALYITVGTFTNSREEGLTFKIMENGKSFTWCVYEHRNIDLIIINGKEGYISCCGDLPYMSDSKSIYLADFSYNEHLKASQCLAQFIIEKHKKFMEAKENEKV